MQYACDATSRKSSPLKRQATTNLQFRRERQKRDVARPLDGLAEPALVARAGARHAARQNLAPLLHEGLEHLDLLVVDEVHVLDAKTADFLFAEILALSAAAWAAGPSARSSRSPGTSAFAAWTASASSMSFGAARWPARVSPFGARRMARSGAWARCFVCCWCWWLIGHRVSFPFRNRFAGCRLFGSGCGNLRLRWRWRAWRRRSRRLLSRTAAGATLAMLS